MGQVQDPSQRRRTRPVSHARRLVAARPFQGIRRTRTRVSSDETLWPARRTRQSRGVSYQRHVGVHQRRMCCDRWRPVAERRGRIQRLAGAARIRLGANGSRPQEVNRVFLRTAAAQASALRKRGGARPCSARHWGKALALSRTFNRTSPMLLPATIPRTITSCDSAFFNSSLLNCGGAISTDKSERVPLGSRNAPVPLTTFQPGGTIASILISFGSRSRPPTTNGTIRFVPTLIAISGFSADLTCCKPCSARNAR